MSIGVRRQLMREMWSQGRMRQRLQNQTLAQSTRPSVVTPEQLEAFVKTLPPGVVPWPLFTDDSNPQ